MATVERNKKTLRKTISGMKQRGMHGDEFKLVLWMCEQVLENGRLYHSDVVAKIHNDFDPAELLSRDEKGSVHLSEGARRQFLCTTGYIGYVKSGQYWRIKRPGDPSGREVPP